MAYTSGIHAIVLILCDAYNHLVVITNTNTSDFDAAKVRKNKSPLQFMDANYAECTCVGGAAGAAGETESVLSARKCLPRKEMPHFINILHLLRPEQGSPLMGCRSYLTTSAMRHHRGSLSECVVMGRESQLPLSTCGCVSGETKMSFLASS